MSLKRIIFIVSTGKSGSCFLANMLNLADNALILHEPGTMLPKDCVTAVRDHGEEKDKFYKSQLANYPEAMGKLEEIQRVEEQGRYQIYGQSHSNVYPFCYHLFKKYGDRLSVIHLVRNPLDTCMSLVAYTHSGVGYFPPDLYRGCETPAQKAVAIWRNVNRIIREQGEMIGSSSYVHCRLEDVSNPDGLSTLYARLGLTGFDRGEVEKELSNRAIRNSASSPKRDAIISGYREEISQLLGEDDEKTYEAR